MQEASNLSKYPQYSCYKFDVGLKKTKYSFPLKEVEKLEDYEQKMDVILETYFNKPAATDTAVDESEPVDVDVEGAVERTDPSMAAYAQAISRTLRS